MNSGSTALPRAKTFLGQRLREGLAAIDGVRILGTDASAPTIGLASVVVDGVHAHDAGQFLDDRGIAARVGHHCAQPLHRRLGATASLRLSAGVHTTPGEVELALEAVAGIRSFFGVEGGSA